MQIWTDSSYKNVFQDEMRDLNAPADRKLVMAKNESESFQIVLRGDTEFVIKSVVFTGLASEAGYTIAAQNLSYGFVGYVYMSRNTINVPAEHAVRAAPGFFPDPISNDRSVKVPRKTSQPVWVTLFVPKDTPAGRYSGVVTVTTNLGDFEVPLQAEVCDVAIPDPADAAFTYMHHQQITGTWWLPARRDPITLMYGYRRWTPEWWELVADIAEKMRSHRQNSLYINVQQLLLDGGTTLDADGNWQFSFSKLDEYAAFFQQAGVVKMLEGTHVTGIDYGTMDFTVILLKPDENGEMSIVMEKYDSPLAERWLAQYLPALQQHVEEKGWLDCWYQHVGDEAMNDRQLSQYAQVLGRIRQYAPRLRVGDPVTHVDFAQYQIDAGVDITIPIEDAYDNHREVFIDAARRGVKVYLYNCCGPGDSWLNRVIDKPVWQMRTLAWLLYDWNIDGFLHWGYNFWNDWAMDEFLEADEEAHKGDHFTVYPDPHRNRICSSIRYEACRDAAEDFELLTILGRRDPARAKALVEKIATDSHTGYTRDIRQMLAAREELVRAAAGEG